MGFAAIEILSSPVGTVLGALPEHVTLVVLDSAIAEKRDKFLFKLAFAMMLLLVLNVSLHNWNLRRADAERAVTFLPGKATPHPPGRTSREFLNGLGNGISCRQDKEQMDMIRCSARGNEREALAAGYTAQVGVELGRSVSPNDGAAIIRAEDTMNEIACVRVGHLAPSLRDSQFTTTHSYPTLKRGANQLAAASAYGAFLRLGELFCDFDRLDF